MDGVKLTKLMDRLGLVNVTPEVDISERIITSPNVNRPALQLAGFFENFDKNRIQLIGNVEYSYMYDKMTSEERHVCFGNLMGYEVPAIVFCRGLEVSPGFKQLAINNNVPVLSTDMDTCSLIAAMVRVLKEELAPTISIHGVLVEIFGEGVLITGESGIGKSESALEIIRRGHRLVSDDVVELRKISDDTIIGRAPDITRHLIELRGIGIIDVKTLFGVQSVKEKQEVNLVIQLEDWVKDKEYDRLGLEDKYTEFLGIKIPVHNIPIRPGRNLAIICEAAAINHRQKKMGYNAAQELYKRVTENLMK
ncbi:MAG: HPr(Ser) kinase/phosphatase [Lachnospiraceae bacterium]|nr:HPr(Ser) kinase/phosphatase [Lachnospiraceae bacterium]MBR6274664.1 HPr(Ser) kinase/phosphatase [Lachnospiraceae bacterium]